MNKRCSFFFSFLFQQFVDDDRKCYLEMNYAFHIRRDWPSTLT